MKQRKKSHCFKSQTYKTCEDQSEVLHIKGSPSKKAKMIRNLSVGTEYALKTVMETVTKDQSVGQEEMRPDFV